MTSRKTFKTTSWIGALALAAALSFPAFAQNGMMGGGNDPSSANAAPQAPGSPQVPPYGYGPGMMMYGYGPGAMMHGYGPGAMMYGYGPMMHGYGPMMGKGYGPGYGYGMHGYGMRGYGPGMMYGYGQGLNLNAKQRHALRRQWQTQAGQQQQLQAQLYQDMSQMQELMAQNNPDPEAIGKVYDRMAQTRRQMLLNGIEMRNKFEHTLTPEQRMRWRQHGPWCPGNAYPDNDD